MIAKIQEDLRNSVGKDLPRQWMELDAGKAICALIVDWLAIFAALLCCSLIGTWWIFPIAFVVIGFGQYALFILGHDAIHGSLLPNHAANDRLSRWCIHGALFMGFEDGRRNHLEHHKLLGSAEDPDRYIHTFTDKDSESQFYMFCLGIKTFGKTVLKVTPFGKLKEQALAKNNVASAIKTTALTYARDRIPVFVDQALLLALFYGVLHLPWWSYPVLWIAPIYFCVFLPDEIRAFAEHAVFMDTEELGDDYRLITFLPPLYERLYFSPHNMNVHAEHHLWPRIPHYNLLKAHEALKERTEIQVRHSYVVFLIEVIKFLRARKRST